MKYNAKAPKTGGKRYRDKMALWLCCLACGIAIVVLSRSAWMSGTVPLERSQEMSDKLARLREENATLDDKVVQLERRIREYQEAASGDGASEAALREDLTEAQLEAGLIAAEGPGVVVVLDYIVTNYGVLKHITDADLLLVVNELNAGGAEAISINGERMIANTEIRNAGNNISINTNQYSVPFEITAIGNPETLHAAMSLYGGVMDTLGELYNISLTKSEKLTVPGFSGVLVFNYAAPVRDMP